MMVPSSSRRSLSLLLLAALASKCSARSWVDVVDSSIYEFGLVDQYRAAIEDDPFDFDKSPEASPSLFPTSAPAANIVEAPTVTGALSMAPSIASTNITECSDDEYLHVIRMYDTWGDGWGETKMKITTVNETSTSVETKSIGMYFTEVQEETKIEHGASSGTVFEGSLDDGIEGTFYVCLEAGKCYDIDVDGSQWQSEVKWDIRAAPGSTESSDVSVGTLAKGLAPMKCQFSIPDKTNGTLACLFSCESLTGSPTPLPTSGSTIHAESSAPSDAPSAAPSSLGSFAQAGTGEPASSTSATSDFPSLVPSNTPIASDFPSSSPTDGTLSHSPGHSLSTDVPTPFYSSLWPSITAFPTYLDSGIRSSWPTDDSTTTSLAATQFPTSTSTRGDVKLPSSDFPSLVPSATGSFSEPNSEVGAAGSAVASHDEIQRPTTSEFPSLSPSARDVSPSASKWVKPSESANISPGHVQSLITGRYPTPLASTDSPSSAPKDGGSTLVSSEQNSNVGAPGSTVATPAEVKRSSTSAFPSLSPNAQDWSYALKWFKPSDSAAKSPEGTQLRFTADSPTPLPGSYGRLPATTDDISMLEPSEQNSKIGASGASVATPDNAKRPTTSEFPTLSPRAQETSKFALRWVKQPGSAALTPEFIQSWTAGDSSTSLPTSYSASSAPTETTIGAEGVNSARPVSLYVTPVTSTEASGMPSSAPTEGSVYPSTVGRIESQPPTTLSTGGDVVLFLSQSPTLSPSNAASASITSEPTRDVRLPGSAVPTAMTSEFPSSSPSSLGGEATPVFLTASPTSVKTSKGIIPGSAAASTGTPTDSPTPSISTPIPSSEVTAYPSSLATFGETAPPAPTATIPGSAVLSPTTAISGSAVLSTVAATPGSAVLSPTTAIPGLAVLSPTAPIPGSATEGTGTPTAFPTPSSSTLTAYPSSLVTSGSTAANAKMEVPTRFPINPPTGPNYLEIASDLLPPSPTTVSSAFPSLTPSIHTISLEDRDSIRAEYLASLHAENR